MAVDNHRRRPKFVEVPLSEIRIDPRLESDPFIVNAYVSLETGKINLALTRILTAEITGGFYRRLASGEIKHISNLVPGNIPLFVAMIRKGQRPTLDLHWSPHAPNEGALTCPDDETALAAYRELNIDAVPCRVLRPKPVPTQEAAIWVKKGLPVPIMVRSVAPDITHYRSLFGEHTPELPEAIDHMVKACVKLRIDIKSFHQQDVEDSEVHYHQMLYSVVCRHERSLDTILRLANLKRQEHALAIVRLSYEAFLNFYIDWISPEFFGPRIQYLAACRRIEAINGPEQNIDLSPLSNFVGLFENAAAKARLSPLGLFYHDHAYPVLSQVVHQSYFGVEEDSNSFSDQNFSEPVSELQICRWLDAITAAIISRIANDVGKHL